MASFIKDLAAQVESILRYVAPGFVFITLLLFEFPQLNDEPTDALRKNPEFIWIAALLLGVTLNGIHIALLEDVLCLLVYGLLWIFQGKNLRSRLNIDTIPDLFKELEQGRRLRKVSSSDSIKALQTRHDGIGATLTFLYCSAYPGFAIVAYEWLNDTPSNAVIFFISSMFLAFGIACDIHYTRCDIWLLEKFNSN